MRSLRSLKCLKTTVELTFTTQKANSCSRWTACFQQEIPFWVNLVQKLKIVGLSWNCVPRLIQMYRIPWRCSTFLFTIGNTFLGKFGPKNQNCQFEMKFRTRLIWICWIAYKVCAVHFSCFRPEKPFLEKFGQKNKNCLLKQKFDTKKLIWICGIQWLC